MTVYLDSSVALRVLLGQPGRLETWGHWERAVASELLGLEIRRAVDRLRVQGRLDARMVATLLRETTIVEESIGVVPLTRTVLRRAALPMATPVRTLDGIHLATALMVRERMEESLIFATHDSKQADAARALGFSVLGTN